MIPFPLPAFPDNRRIVEWVEIFQPQPIVLPLCFFLFHAVFLVELLNTSTSCCSFLLSCIERMAFGADFYMDIFFCRSCYKCISTVAGYSCLMICRMDSFFHFLHLFLFFIICPESQIPHFSAHNPFSQVDCFRIGAFPVILIVSFTKTLSNLAQLSNYNISFL